MIRHVLKMVWNRRRQNVWIIAEISVSMIVLLALGVAALTAWQRYREPMGFDPHDLWLINGVAQVEGPADEAIRRQADELATYLRDHPQVDQLGVGLFRPYSGEAMTTVFTAQNGRSLVMSKFYANSDFQRTADLDMVAGRWLSEQDRGVSDLPVVITEGLAQELFEGRDAVDKTFNEGDEGPIYRIVGVVRDFRWDGELSAGKHTLFQPMWHDRPGRFPLRTFIMEMASEAGIETEKQLLAGLQARAPDWSFDLDRVSDLRRDHLRQGLTPLVATGIVAAFLILMVGLGLTGVLWQNITRRTREFGLRRAQGAAIGAIHRQVVGEVWVLTALGVVPVLVLVVQIPLFGVLGSVKLSTLAGAFVLSAWLLFLLTTACALYPCRMVTRQTPGEALHHE